jgi:hypothetical protein
VYQLARQHDDDGIGVEIARRGALSLQRVPIRMTQEAASGLVRLLQLGTLDVESPRRVGPEALQEIGSAEARLPLGSATLRVRRLLMPKGGTNVELEVTTKAWVSFQIFSVWLTAAQATALQALLESASVQAGATR